MASQNGVTVGDY
jgi:drug/metabolite transporter (DMT)-like permease